MAFDPGVLGILAFPRPAPLSMVKLKPLRGSGSPPPPLACRYGLRQQGALQDWPDGN